MKTLIFVFIFIVIVLGIGYILLTETTYLDFVKNWPVLGMELCCIQNETADW